MQLFLQIYGKKRASGIFSLSLFILICIGCRLMDRALCGLIGLAVLFVLLGVLMLLGRGDWLIAGYNTASSKEKDRVHIGRLRVLVGGLLFYVAVLLPIVKFYAAWWFPSIPILVGVFPVIILANTWAVKK